MRRLLGLLATGLGEAVAWLVFAIPERRRTRFANVTHDDEAVR